MNRYLYLDGQLVDIDDSTAIGIDLQAFDIKEPAEMRSSTSNNFSIPKTSLNMKVAGFAGNKHFASRAIYDKLSCTYNISNTKLINNGVAYVTSIDDRINLFASGKAEMWEQMKTLKYDDFETEYMTFLADNYSLPFNLQNPYAGTFNEFLEEFKDTDNICLPNFLSNYYAQNGQKVVRLHYEGDYKCGAWCAKIVSIFKFIESKYSVDFNIDETFAGNIFQDAFFNNTCVRLGNVVSDYNLVRFEINPTFNFKPYKSVKMYKDKSLYDLVKVIFQQFNVLIDYDGRSFKVRRFDDIKSSEVKIFENVKALDSQIKMKPEISNWNQNNWIAFSEVYEGGENTFNSKYIECKNKNIEAGKSDSPVFSIDAFAPTTVDNLYTDLSEEACINEFTLILLDGTLTTDVSVFDVTLHEYSVVLPWGKVLSLSGEYNIIESMLEYPEVYEINIWLDSFNADRLEFFNMYKFKELNGIFFLNSVKGYNPAKSRQAVTFELIKIPF